MLLAESLDRIDWQPSIKLSHSVPNANGRPVWRSWSTWPPAYSALQSDSFEPDAGVVHDGLGLDAQEHRLDKAQGARKSWRLDDAGKFQVGGAPGTLN